MEESVLFKSAIRNPKSEIEMARPHTPLAA